MSKGRKEYISETALGELYDMVTMTDFLPVYETPFDKRILDAYPENDEHMKEAALIKEEYDEDVRKIMKQHEIKTEFEVWSTFVLAHDSDSNDYKFHTKIGELSTALKDSTRTRCYKYAGKEYEKIAPFVVAMYQVTNKQVQYVLETHPERPIPWTEMPFISFPWIFASILGEVALGRGGISHERLVPRIDANKPTIKPPYPERSAEDLGTEESALKTQSGVKQIGEILSLFNDASVKPANAEDIIKFGQGNSSSEGTSSEGAASLCGSEKGGNSSNVSEAPKDEIVKTSNDHTSLLDRLTKMNAG
jgi:RNA-dependent RNA polymerase